MQVLDLLATSLRLGGILLLHFALPGQGGWRTEADWLADRSIAGRARLRYGLHCFGRSAAELTALVGNVGFDDVTVRPLNGLASIPGDEDIATQHLLSARRSDGARLPPRSM
jgi:hypothetical protein